MENGNNTSVPAEEVKDITTATGNSSSCSAPQLPQPQHHHHHQQQPSVNISLSDTSEILEPFFGTGMTLPSSQQQQQQRGRPQDSRHSDVITPEAPTDNSNNNMDPTQDVSTEEEASCSAVENSRGLTSGDEKSGAAPDVQGMEEFMEAPGNSWMEAVWEMELERSRMLP